MADWRTNFPRSVAQTRSVNETETSATVPLAGAWTLTSGTTLPIDTTIPISTPVHGFASTAFTTTGNGIFTCAIAGTYAIHGSMISFDIANGAYISVNDGVDKRLGLMYSEIANVVCSVAAVWTFDVGDTVRLESAAGVRFQGWSPDSVPRTSIVLYRI